MERFTRKLVLENGLEFYGQAFGARGEVVAELVFNTSMVGYQEIVSDPACTGQMVVMTYPLIGNYGMADEDYESRHLTMGGLVVREYNDTPSNFRYTKTLSERMEEDGTPGISGVDTRMLARIVQSQGSQKAMLADADKPLDQALEQLRAYELPRDAVARVSSPKKWYSRTSNPRYNVAVVDCGIKLSIIKGLNKYGCNVTVLPYNTAARELMGLNPDGVFISNGPGNPQDASQVVQLVRALRGKLPIFGICLGYQAICLAYGAKTYKLKLGHRGSNHPVRDLATGKIEIVSQNTGYAVDGDTLAGTGLEVTHVNLLDGVVEGVECRQDRLFGVQYHPQSEPGPEESTALFRKFVMLMEEERNA